MTKEIKDFRQRIKKQKEDNQLYRSMGGDESGEVWNVFSGDYSKPIFPSEFGSPTICGSEDYSGRELPEELMGVEVTLKKIIDNLLLREKLGRPVIIFDYGGGVGISWCRLALNFQKEITSGRLVMIVSNIEVNYFPSYPVSAHFHELDLRSQAFNLAKKDNLVQWIVAEPLPSDNGNLKSLRHFNLKENLPLLGNTDLIFSRMSLIHSHIPDLHLHRLIELLSDKGIFIEASAHYEKQKEVFAQSYGEAIPFYNLQKVQKVEVGPNKDKPILHTILRKKSLTPPPIWA